MAIGSILFHLKAYILIWIPIHQKVKTSKISNLDIDHNRLPKKHGVDNFSNLMDEDKLAKQWESHHILTSNEDL